MAIAMAMRVQDNFLSIGLTSLRWNGSLTVAAVREPFGPLFRTNLRVAALHFAGRYVQATFWRARYDRLPMVEARGCPAMACGRYFRIGDDAATTDFTYPLAACLR